MTLDADMRVGTDTRVSSLYAPWQQKFSVGGGIERKEVRKEYRDTRRRGRRRQTNRQTEKRTA